MTMLSTWRPQRWSQSWSLMASNAASTMRRFCSTLIPSSTPLLRMVSGVFRLDERKRDRRPGKDPDEYAGVATKMASYGVHAIELNLSCPHAKGLGTEIAQDEAAVRDFTRAVKDAVSLPVFPKLSPNVQDIAAFAVAAEEGGADGIVAINTVKAMAIVPELKMPFLANKFGGLSGPAIRPIGVRAVYDICEKVHIPVVGVGGIGSGRDALEYIMAGACAVQVGTAIIPKGLAVFDEIVKEMGSLLEEAGFASVSEAIGVAHA